jgi:hypothetical protein
MDSNHRRQSQQIYSLPHLATLVTTLAKRFALVLQSECKGRMFWRQSCTNSPRISDFNTFTQIESGPIAFLRYIHHLLIVVPKVPEKATFGTTIGIFLMSSCYFPIILF